MQHKIRLLKTGCSIEANGILLLIDPPAEEAALAQADYILFTESGASLVDVERLKKMLLAAPRALLLVSKGMKTTLRSVSFDPSRIETLSEQWSDCSAEICVRSVGGNRTRGLGKAEAIRTNDERDTDYEHESGSGSYLICFNRAGFAGNVSDSVSSQLLVLGDDSLPSESLLSELQTSDAIHTLVARVGAQNRFKPQSSSSKHCFSVHEAYDLAEQLNVSQIVVRPQEPVTPQEVRTVFEARPRLRASIPQPNLLIEPDYFYVGQPKASVVIRTLNEARYLDELLRGIGEQLTNDLDTEVVLVDSGSTDGTLAIAEKHGCKIVHIKREEFSFGRSLNRGCEAAQGDILVITSGHCVPANDSWLQNLCQPLIDGISQYSYGKQLGGPTSYFSECRVFDKYFPDTSKLPQDGFYCNNANSALLKTTWQRYRFDEELTGLEDMALAQRMVRDGGKVAYVSDAPVYHYHSETWPQVRRRFEREAIALQQIMPNVHVGWFDTLRYTISSIWGDLKKAAESKQLTSNLTSIIRYRYYQYTGSYRGNQQHRKLSQAEKDQYFYPH